MADSIEKTLEQAHRLIAVGKGAQAREGLEKLKANQIPRPLLARAAELARRAHLYEKGIQWLFPFVRGNKQRPAEPTEAEKAEYAACLNKLGSGEEAFALLRAVDTREAPQALLYQTFVLTTRWQYADAIPLLEAYLRMPASDAYQSLIAKVNLVDALVYERRHPQAQALLSHLLHDTSLARYRLLRGNLLQIGGLDAFLRGRISQAEKLLGESVKVLGGTGFIDQLYARKWRALLRLRKEKGSTGSVNEVLAVRREATASGHWETVRDCDRWLSIVTRDQGLLRQVYFGTPHASFRRRLLEDFGAPVSLPATYLWALHGDPKGKSIVSLPPSPRGSGGLKPGMLLHRLLAALSADFYRPVLPASLFHALYPDELYRPETSHPRVRELLRRLREWSRQRRLGLGIQWKEGGYALHATKDLGILVGGQAQTEIASSGRLRTLEPTFRDRWFSAAEIARPLDISSRSARRLLLEAVRDQAVERRGSGVSTRYRFPRQGTK